MYLRIADDRPPGLTRRGQDGCWPFPQDVVTEAQAAAIRTAYEQRGEFSAAVELAPAVPGITDNGQAQECARAIALAAVAQAATPDKAAGR